MLGKDAFVGCWLLPIPPRDPKAGQRGAPILAGPAAWMSSGWNTSGMSKGKASSCFEEPLPPAHGLEVNSIANPAPTGL